MGCKWKPITERAITDGATWASLFNAYTTGATLAEIGQKHGISMERVRQVVTQYAGAVGKDAARRKANKAFVRSPDVLAREAACKMYSSKRKRLLELLNKADVFPREAVLAITGWPDEGTDQELCVKLRGLFITRFGSYRWCSLGKHAVLLELMARDVSRGGYRTVCRQCSNKWQVELTKRLGWRIKKANTPSWKRRIYAARYWAKRTGKPLPPLDKPLPPLSEFPKGWKRIVGSKTKEELRVWINQRVAARKAKQAERAADLSAARAFFTAEPEEKESSQ